MNNQSKRQGLLPYRGTWPTVDQSVFIAPGALVIGNTTVAAYAGIWFNVVIRGDVAPITIGERTNVQDNTVLHVSYEPHPLRIGAHVTIGHNATVHGCTVEDLVLIGIGATVLDGAVVRTNSIVAAGAVVPPRMEVPSGVLVAGVPARVVRPLTTEEIARIAASAERYVGYAADYATDEAGTGVENREGPHPDRRI